MTEGEEEELEVYDKLIRYSKEKKEWYENQLKDLHFKELDNKMMWTSTICGKLIYFIQNNNLETEFIKILSELERKVYLLLKKIMKDNV